MSEHLFVIDESPFYSKDVITRPFLQEVDVAEGDGMVLARKRRFKKDEYIKFIIKNKFDITAYYKLSNIAKTTMQFIIYDCLDYNTPTFILVAKDLAMILNIDTSVVHKGIRQLIKEKYIARTKTKSVYWINHNRYYKGNYMIDKHIIKN